MADSLVPDPNVLIGNSAPINALPYSIDPTMAILTLGGTVDLGGLGGAPSVDVTLPALGMAQPAGSSLNPTWLIVLAILALVALSGD